MAIGIHEFIQEKLLRPLFSRKEKKVAINLSHDQAKSLLNAMSNVSRAKDMETLMSTVRTAARELTGAQGATFVLREGDKCFYTDEDAIEPLWKGKRFPMKICISGWAMIHKKSAVIEDIYLDPRIPADAYKPTFVKSLVMVPIKVNNPVGAIGAYWAEKYNPTPDKIFLLEALAKCTSDAMKNIKS